MMIFDLWSAAGGDGDNEPMLPRLVGALVGGGLFSLIMTASTYVVRKSLRLSRWEDLDAAAQ